MTELTREQLEELVKRVTERSAHKLTRWGMRCLWLAVALIATAIIMTSWQLFGLGILAAIIAGSYLLVAGNATSRETRAQMTDLYRQHMRDSS